MQLVDEENNILYLADLVHDGLDPLLELPTIFRSRHHKGKIQGYHALLPQDLRHISRSYLLGQTFHYGGLADTRFAHHHRIVLGPATQNLDHTLDFGFTTNHGIEFSIPGKFCKVPPKSPQGRRLGFAFTAPLH